MPSKDRSFHDSPEETGVEAWLSSELHQLRPFAMTMPLYVANSSFTSINMSCNLVLMTPAVPVRESEAIVPINTSLLIKPTCESVPVVQAIDLTNAFYILNVFDFRT